MTAIESETANEMQVLPLGQLFESPWNPRQHYDADALKELAESFKAVGQITPIVARPQEKGGIATGRFEIAAGHRRFRAAKLAGLEEVLVRVVELDDVQFLEILNIENLQRDDLHPLEEAQGYRQLMEKAGYDVAKIAAKVGKSEKYVYDRIKLLQLIAPLKKLFLEEKITAGHAILLARLSSQDQKRALGDGSGDKYSGNPGGLFEDEDGHWQDQEALDLDDPVKPLSVRELAQWIDDNVRATEKTIDPFLFPQTSVALAKAQEEEEKVVHITHDFRVTDGARDEKQRTYGEQAWKRADGKRKSKACDFRVLGVVVAGFGRGEAFYVCVNKKKCSVHWPDEVKLEQARAKAKKKAAGKGEANADEDDGLAQQRRDDAAHARYEAEERVRKAERARWKKALPALRKALAAGLKSLPATGSSKLGKYILAECLGYAGKASPLIGKATPDDLLRQVAFARVEDSLSDWNPGPDTTQAFKELGLDAIAIVDQVAPTEKAAPKKVPGKKKGGRK